MAVLAGLIAKRVSLGDTLKFKAKVPSVDGKLPTRDAEITLKFTGYNERFAGISVGLSCQFKDNAPQVLIDKAEANPARRGGSFGTLSGLVNNAYETPLLAICAERIADEVELFEPYSPNTLFHKKYKMWGSVNSYSPNHLSGELHGSGRFLD